MGIFWVSASETTRRFSNSPLKGSNEHLHGRQCIECTGSKQTKYSDNYYVSLEHDMRLIILRGSLHSFYTLTYFIMHLVHAKVTLRYKLA